MKRTTVTQPASQQVNDDYRLLLSPAFAAMTKITENLFLTGVGGMTRENFAKNHIDFVVNITVDAPFWQDVESIRIALEDDANSNILHYLDFAVDKIHEAITKRQAHVLVHCVAGVSRSATIVIAYLMKVRRLDLKSAFNYCYNLRPIIRPNNGFMVQLINYEYQLFGRASSVRMIEADVDGTLIKVPNFFIEEHPRLVLLEVLRTRDDNQKSLSQNSGATMTSQKITPGLHHQSLAQASTSTLTCTQTNSSTMAQSFLTHLQNPISKSPNSTKMTQSQSGQLQTLTRNNNSNTKRLQHPHFVAGHQHKPRAVVSAASKATSIISQVPSQMGSSGASSATSTSQISPASSVAPKTNSLSTQATQPMFQHQPEQEQQQEQPQSQPQQQTQQQRSTVIGSKRANMVKSAIPATPRSKD